MQTLFRGLVKPRCCLFYFKTFVCSVQSEASSIPNFTITAEIHARSLANFYCQYADRHMNLKFMRRVSEREPAINSAICYRKKQIDASF